MADKSSALGEGWKPIADAPKDGSSVRVGHHLDPSSLKIDTIMPVYGTFENGSWACNAGFVCIDRLFRFEPSVWLPASKEPTA